MGEKVKMTQVAKPGTEKERMMQRLLKDTFDQRLLAQAHQIWVTAPTEYKARKLAEALEAGKDKTADDFRAQRFLERQ